ncbi:hypothetical protein NKR23_g4104 [Pleurostoma richardsiae]|uniref:Uncharacterized protein n=1 Tax=Pleurostoma richardsiae TaxID=41990 RepID=A0AA38RK34_9PEZI|nr:hypothetical protein NKR23_g4104 [Pleurostoma richardsiae]
MGPMQELQGMLEAAFDTWYDALNDTVGWNDCRNLNALSMTLSNLGGLDEEVHVLFSAQVAELGLEECEDEEDGDGAERESGDSDSNEEEDETVNSDEEFEGDLADASYGCCGECKLLSSGRLQTASRCTSV